MFSCNCFCRFVNVLRNSFLMSFFSLIQCAIRNTHVYLFKQYFYNAPMPINWTCDLNKRIKAYTDKKNDKQKWKWNRCTSVAAKKKMNKRQVIIEIKCEDRVRDGERGAERIERRKKISQMQSIWRFQMQTGLFIPLFHFGVLDFHSGLVFLFSASILPSFSPSRVASARMMCFDLIAQLSISVCRPQMNEVHSICI